MRKEEVASCIFCNTKGVEVYKKLEDGLFGVNGKWDYLACPKDGNIWLNPRPVIEDIGEIYNSYYTHSEKKIVTRLGLIKAKYSLKFLNTYYNYPNIRATSLEGFFLKRIPLVKDIFASSVMWLPYSKKAKLLDVGCGNGNFMNYMQSLGWAVNGVEVDKKVVNFIKNNTNHKVFHGEIFDVDHERYLFDAITANHVIEHVHNPVLFMKKANKLLKPGGRFVVTTPNINSFGSKFFKGNWRGLEVPRHLHLLNLKSMEICANKSGFIIEELRTSSRSTWEIWYASRLLKKYGGIDNGFPKRLNLYLRLESILMQIVQSACLVFKKDIGEVIVFIGRKI